MTQTVLGNPLEDVWWNSSSSSSETIEKYRSHIHDIMLNTQLDVENFVSSFTTHKKIVTEGTSTSENIRPLYYVKFPRSFSFSSPNSSSNMLGTVEEYYNKVEVQLNLLSASDEADDDGVEQGAIDSALVLVEQLKRHNLAPPALSWHGGDAVVMLWALGDTTYAITVTDGEIGYVVRRNRKAIRMADSIKLDTFKLADLR